MHIEPFRLRSVFPDSWSEELGQQHSRSLTISPVNLFQGTDRLGGRCPAERVLAFFDVARIYTREGNLDSDFSWERLRFVHLADDQNMFS